MALMEVQLYSHQLGMEMAVDVILPQPGPGEPAKTYPVLWLYHGGSGDHTAWVRNSSVESWAEERGIAVVMPGVHRSCFINMNRGGRYGSYVGRELPERLRRLLPGLSHKREENFVAGFSNGGYGCLQAGLLNPDLYGAIGAFSAGDKADADFTGREAEKQILFGEGDLHKTPYSIRYNAQQLLERGGPFPKIYHAIGSKDPWLWQTTLLREYFTSLPGNPFCYQHHTMEGLGHEWDFWNAELLNFFDYLGL